MLSYEQFKKHPVREAAKRTLDTINSLPNAPLEILSYKRKLKSFLSYIVSNIEKTDHEFTPQIVLSAVNTKLSESISEIDKYKQDLNIEHLENSINQLGAALRAFPVPFISRYVSQNYRHIESFREKGEALIKEIRARADGVDGSLEEVSDQIAHVKNSVQNLEDRAASVIDGIQNSFSESQSSKNKQFSDWMNSQESRISLEIEKSKESTIENNKAISEIKDANKKHVQSLTDQFEEEMVKIRASFKSERDSFTKISKEAIDDIRSMRTEIRSLYKLTGDDALVGGYQGQANSEAASANWLRGIAIVLMVVSAGLLVYPELIALGNNQADSFEWIALLERLPLSTILLVPALYAARESGKHRSIERSFRAIELQISTLDPFISKLQETKQREIKTSLIEKYFSGPPSDNKVDRNRSEFDKIIDTLRNLIGENGRT